MTEALAVKNRDHPPEYNFEDGEWNMVSDLRYIPIAVRQLERKLKKAGWSGMGVVDLVTSFGEILRNAVLHGNLDIHNRSTTKTQEGTPGLPETWDNVAKKVLKNNPELREKQVNISIDITEREVKIIVRDQGNGFNPGAVRDPTVGVAKFDTAGRGLLHARYCLDKLSFDFTNGTAVTMIKRRG